MLKGVWTQGVGLRIWGFLSAGFWVFEGTASAVLGVSPLNPKPLQYLGFPKTGGLFLVGSYDKKSSGIVGYILGAAPTQ